MSLREEQCNKVCRILDDVLANRPTERDSLIVATRSAFSALSEPHWIPITERLPQVNEEVLITLSFGDIITMGWINKDGEWLIYEGNVNADINDILAWQPLPEPYKGVTDGRD